jgi:hypothetical protein
MIFFPRKPAGQAFVLTYFFAQVSQNDKLIGAYPASRLDIQTIEGYCRFLGWEESEPWASILASRRFRAAI